MPQSQHPQQPREWIHGSKKKKSVIACNRIEDTTVSHARNKIEETTVSHACKKIEDTKVCQACKKIEEARVNAPLRIPNAYLNVEFCSGFVDKIDSFVRQKSVCNVSMT